MSHLIGHQQSGQDQLAIISSATSKQAAPLHVPSRPIPYIPPDSDACASFISSYTCPHLQTPNRTTFVIFRRTGSGKPHLTSIHISTSRQIVLTVSTNLAVQKLFLVRDKTSLPKLPLLSASELQLFTVLHDSSHVAIVYTIVVASMPRLMTPKSLPYIKKIYFG